MGEPTSAGRLKSFTCPYNGLSGQVEFPASRLCGQVDALVSDLPRPNKKSQESRLLGGYDLAMPLPSFNAERPLTSWKEIAHYFNKSVRTVQRWEQQFGLPIRRPDVHDHGIVIAFPNELADWMQSHLNLRRANGNGKIRITAAAAADRTADRVPHSNVETRRLELLSALRQESTELRQRSRALKETMMIVKSNWSRLRRNESA